MKNYSTLILALFLCLTSSLFAQFGSKPVRPDNPPQHQFDPANFQVNEALLEGVPRSERPLPTHLNYKTLAGSQLNAVKDQSELKPLIDPSSGRIIGFEGTMNTGPRSSELEANLPGYLQEVNQWLAFENIEGSFMEKGELMVDDLGLQHQKLTQYYRDIPVYGAEAIVHAKNGKPYLINGRFLPEPGNINVVPSISSHEAKTRGLEALKALTNVRELTKREQKYTLSPNESPELIIYHGNHFDQPGRLVWYAHLIPNVLEHWEVFIDAHTGEVIHQIKASCTIAPLHLYGISEKHNHDACLHKTNHSTHSNNSNFPTSNPGTTADAVDLKGITRRINVFFDPNTPIYALLDVAQPMYDQNSSIPDNIRGAIMTLDAQNTNPRNSDFDANFVFDNDNNWNNPKGVSAHFHAEVAYDYFRNTFNRNSINGQGGNIISIINVSETNGAGMDNAFWNGAAMFYGNGDRAFSSALMKSLDTGGHEMTHGVIQSTAGLIYENQSGALNESFADVFGVLIDPVNWQLGEDIVNPNSFPSGALRDMSDPNQGGSGLSSPGWQPDHMDEFVNLPNTPQGDNGGVHINSGIPNHAFYLLAQSVGNEKAGRMFYDALSIYLTRSSQFIDLRLAVEQSATQRYGQAELNAVRAAFDGVGIGGGTGTSGPEDLPRNEGTEFVLASTGSQEGLFLYDLTQDAPQISSTEITSRPSVTDDGSVIVFVDNLNRLKVMIRNNQGQYEEDFIEQNPQQIWRNIAISKDGSKIAALTTDFDNLLFIFDFISQTGQNLEIVTPTTAQGVSTNDVQYADFIEWDYTGESVLFDAYNVIDDDLGNSSDYWDIGLIEVWDNQQEIFGSGRVQKVFSSLPDNSSVGNPTFSKNSPFIIAFDFIGDAENFSDLALLGANIETGDVGLIYENDVLSYPNYSIDDDRVVFDIEDLFGNSELNVISLNNDKISASGNAAGFLNGGHWGVWFANGARDLTSTNNLNNWDGKIEVSPNPFDQFMQIELDVPISAPLQLSLYNPFGQLMRKQHLDGQAGQQTIIWETNILGAGLYLLEVEQAGQQKVMKLVK